MFSLFNFTNSKRIRPQQCLLEEESIVTVFTPEKCSMKYLRYVKMNVVK